MKIFENKLQKYERKNTEDYLKVGDAIHIEKGDKSGFENKLFSN